MRNQPTAFRLAVRSSDGSHRSEWPHQVARSCYHGCGTIHARASALPVRTLRDLLITFG